MKLEVRLSTLIRYGNGGGWMGCKEEGARAAGN